METFCIACGAALPPESRFCASCGKPVGEQVATEATDESSIRPAKKMRKKRVLITSAAALLVAILGVTGVVVANKQAEDEAKRVAAARFKASQSEVAGLFSKAVASCDVEPGILSGFTVEYNFLEIDSKGEEDWFGSTYAQAECALDALEMPAATKSRWGATRALDGTVEDSWEGAGGKFTINAYWSYHPDSGTLVTLELESKFLRGYKPPVEESDSKNS